MMLKAAIMSTFASVLFRVQCTFALQMYLIFYENVIHASQKLMHICIIKGALDKYSIISDFSKMFDFIPLEVLALVMTAC